MNKPEKLKLHGMPDNVEVLHEGDRIVMRTIVDPAKVRAACREIRKFMPKVKKGESIVRDLNKMRIRGGDER